MLKDAVRALSLANLLFLPVWAGLGDLQYLAQGRTIYIAVFLNVLAVMATLVAAANLVRHVGNRWLTASARLAFGTLMLVPLNWLRMEYTDVSVTAVLPRSAVIPTALVLPPSCTT